MNLVWHALDFYVYIASSFVIQIALLYPNSLVFLLPSLYIATKFAIYQIQPQLRDISRWVTSVFPWRKVGQVRFLLLVVEQGAVFAWGSIYMAKCKWGIYFWQFDDKQALASRLAAALMRHEPQNNFILPYLSEYYKTNQL